MYEFSLTPQQEMLKKSAREFAEKEIDPLVSSMDETGETPIELIKKMSDLGFADISPAGPMNHTSTIAVIEEISMISPAMGFALQCLQAAQAPLIYFGSDEQKDKFLSKLSKGEVCASSAVTEPSGGSDLFGIETTAKKEGDHYILNGRKCFITNAHISDVHTVLAKTGEGPKGFSLFIVEKERGVKLGRKEDKLGLRGLNTGEIIFNDVEVPIENLIGKEGDGLKIAMSTFSNFARPGCGAVALGIINRCIEEAAMYAKERTAYGKPISNIQAIQFYLAEMYADYETARVISYYAAWLRDKKERCDAQNALSKYYPVEASIRCASKLVRILGGYGITKGIPAERLLRDAESLMAPDGTQEIMKAIMWRKALEFAR
ncbi:MAG: putative acyl-CoA dehydrogenase [Candidatus Methanolliviera sp. GoM_asphalt]|nr:MAG: putative acyl-CoA dehydrogenase [Candidatus Methanolliviera sp. GoM_asphalt]